MFSIPLQAIPECNTVISCVAGFLAILVGKSAFNFTYLTFLPNSSKSCVNQSPLDNFVQFEVRYVTFHIMYSFIHVEYLPSWNFFQCCNCCIWHKYPAVEQTTCNWQDMSGSGLSAAIDSSLTDISGVLAIFRTRHPAFGAEPSKVEI